MTKQTRMLEIRDGDSGALAFHPWFGFRHSFDIRHSGFVIITSA